MQVTLRKTRENQVHTSYRIFIGGQYAGDVTLNTGDESKNFVQRMRKAFNLKLEDGVVEAGG